MDANRNYFEIADGLLLIACAASIWGSILWMIIAIILRASGPAVSP